ncbi:hypothetical protein M9H77_10823 [Catharanthus roseus]|uniref:Uncharacterized protein n=1 Tax=Catharanthus roseus TaxID=4058 RepID=A0ACC0BCR5_CATRO|nr:hypothetical protein M9H77_10823 [Catharanthus roseus]
MLALRKLINKNLKSSPTISTINRYFTTGTANSISETPSSAYYDELINNAGRDRDFATVQQLLSKRFRDGCFNTNHTFKFISTDISILDDLLKALARLENGFPRKSAHDCLIAQLCRLPRMQDAVRVAEIMVRKQYGANATTFHPILNALTRKKAMDEVWRVMEMMRVCEIEPDVTAYNSILTAYCFSGDLNSAASVLSRMVEEGKVADTRTYDALVLGACRAGKIEGALRLLRRMAYEGVLPLYSTHAHVINAMVKNGYYAQAVEFVMSFAGKDKGLDTENFEILGVRLINSKRDYEAKFVVEEMVRRGLAMGEKLKDFYHVLCATEGYISIHRTSSVK